MAKSGVFFTLETAMKAQDCLITDKPPIIRIEALAVNLETKKILDKFEVKIKFNLAKADLYILGFTSYVKEVWESEAVMPLEAAERFVKWSSKYACAEIEKGSIYNNLILCGHNVNKWGIPVLLKWYKAVEKAYAKELNFSGFYNSSIDTLELAHTLDAINRFEGRVPKRLQSLREYYELPKNLSKVETARLLWVAMMEILEEGNKAF